MTEHSDTGRQTALRDRLNDAAEDFFPASPPYDAIVGDARRRTRIRAISGSALSVVALGAAVAVGVSAFGGPSGSGGSKARAVGAGSLPATAPTTAAPSSAPPVAPETDHYGRTVVAQGDFKGVHWTLTRDLNRKDGVTIPTPPGASGPQKGSWADDDVYFTAANGLRDRAGAGGGTTPGHLAELLDHFGTPNSGIVASVGTTNLGVGSMDDSWKKENPSPYRISFLSGIVSSKVARVKVVFPDGTSQDAALVASPAGEDGQYFYLPFENGSWTSPNVTVVYYDAKGTVLKP